VILKDGFEESPELVKTLKNEVRQRIGPIASPDHILVSPGLPKTRSGKIMRRILRKVASLESDQLGDTSTLAEPEIVDILIEKREKLG
jgi:acetyl-CoA synthetase